MHLLQNVDVRSISRADVLAAAAEAHALAAGMRGSPDQAAGGGVPPPGFSTLASPIPGGPPGTLGRPPPMAFHDCPTGMHGMGGGDPQAAASMLMRPPHMRSA